ncbi:MAG: hypothetical protein J7L32_00315, partial [Thermoplasmata archaeon]|nr:hypothetical protein [Thermoplasmata archaeon]
MKRRMRNNKKAVANPIEFTIVIGVLITAFTLLFVSLGQMFVPYQVSNVDLSAKAMAISDRLIKDVGMCVDGSTDWEYHT